MGTFFDELKRRNVVRVGIAYVVVCWLVFQIGEILFPEFGAPDWVFKTLILLLAIGFPFAMIFAWAFDLTPDGIKKTKDVHVGTSVTASTGRRLDFIIIAALVVALIYFVWERQSPIGDATTNSVAEPIAEEMVDETVATGEKPRRSIAVIPFVNMSSDKEQEWFADGLTEEILNSLARTPDLLVAARTSSFTFKGSNQDIPSIAASLGVDHILEGSVRRSGDRLRVTAQLVRASDGFHLWSENYDRAVDDMIDIQENVAIEIANALESNIGRWSRRKLRKGLEGLDPSCITDICWHDWHGSLRNVAASVALDRHQGDLRCALLALSADPEDVDAEELSETENIADRVRSREPSDALLRQVMQTWCSRIGRR